MDIKDFLNLNVGNWFSQRTSYELAQENALNCKSDLIIEFLAGNSPELVNLAGELNRDGQNFLGATKTNWDNSVDWGKPKEKGYSLLVLIPETEHRDLGKIIIKNSQGTSGIKQGRYVLGNDEALTLIVEDNVGYFEERIWFASSNLRLRTTLFKVSDEFSHTCFYSEIRKMAPQS